MSSIRSYGKVNPLDQANLDARRRAKKRLTITGLSSSALVTIIVIISVLAVNRNNSSDESNPSSRNSFSTSIKAMCDATLYPNSCMTSISPMANSTDLDPVKLFNLSVQVAIDGLSKISRQFEEIQSNSISINDTMSLLGFSNCNELIELAINHLNDCIMSPTDFSLQELTEDIKTWLSSAITNQQTCIDGFANSTEFNSRVSDLLKN